MSHGRVSVYLFVCECSNFSIATKAIRTRICISKKNWQKTTYLLYGPNWIQAAIQYKSQIWLDSVLFTMQSPQYSSSIFLFDLRCFIETLHSMEQSKHRKRTETHTHTWNKLILPAVLKLMEQMCRFSAVYMYNSDLHFNSTPNGCMMVC